MKHILKMILYGKIFKIKHNNFFFKYSRSKRLFFIVYIVYFDFFLQKTGSFNFFKTKITLTIILKSI